MTAEELKAHMATVERLRADLARFSKDASEWAFMAGNTDQHRDAIGLLFKGRDLASALLDELIAASVEASTLRILVVADQTEGGVQ